MTEPDSLGQEVVVARRGGGRFGSDVALTVGGMFAWGFANYVVYAVGARALTPDQFAQYALWWTGINVLSVGLFSAFEATGPHLITGALLTGRDGGVTRWMAATGLRTWALACVIFIAGCAAVSITSAVAWWWLVPWGLLNLFAAAAASVQRGIAVGYRDFVGLALQLIVTAVVQVLCLLSILWLEIGSLPTMAAATGVAPLAGVLAASFRGLRPAMRADRLPREQRAEALRSLVSLSFAAIASQIMHNATLFTAQREGLSAKPLGGYVGLLTLGRVPLMLFNPIGAPLLPRMTHAANVGDKGSFVRIVRGIYGSCIALAIIGSLAAWALGPWALSIYLGPEFAVPRLLMISVAAASALFLLNSLVRLALVSLGRSTSVARGWTISLLVLVLMLVLPIPLWWKLGLATPVALSALLAVLSFGLLRGVRERFAG